MARWLLSIFLLLCVSTVWGGEREYVTRARKGREGSEKEWVSPFLITTTALRSEKSPDAALATIRAYFEQGGAALPGAGKLLDANLFTAESFSLPEFVTSDKQGEGIEKCKTTYCLMKLHTPTETTALEVAPSKKGAYHGIVLSRVKEYLLRRALRGYEDRLDNVAFMKESLKLTPFLPELYPALNTFLSGPFWEKAKAPAQEILSQLHSQRLFLEIDKMQPVWWLAHFMVFKEGAGYVMVDIPIYTNHYFDSCLAVYEILPDGTGSVLTQTDVMELDELKKSGLIRMLYKGKMQEAIALFQRKRLKEWL